MVNVQGRVIEEVFSNRYEEQEGSMSVAEYAAKFDELSRFCPYINVEGAEESKCVKFEMKVRKTQEGGVELCSQKLFRSLR